MRFAIAACTVAVVWGVGVSHTSVRAQAPAKSTWDGVFSDEQAKRGEAAYSKACSECHGADLGGDGFAPALGGSDFSTNWGGLSVGDLLDRIRISMPPTDPGSISLDAKADIVAHLLHANKFPAGTTELKGDVAAAKGIEIKINKPEQ